MIDEIILEDIEKIKSALKREGFAGKKCWLLEAQGSSEAGSAMC
jgi:hypothetical protein